MWSQLTKDIPDRRLKSASAGFPVLNRCNSGTDGIVRMGENQKLVVSNRSHLFGDFSMALLYISNRKNGLIDVPLVFVPQAV
jgi:hypothetical protein